MPKMYIPTILRPLTRGQSLVKLSGATVAEVMATLEREYPGTRAQLYDDGGQVKPHIAIFVNDENIRDLDGEATVLSDRDDVHIIPAIAGGCDQ